MKNSSIQLYYFYNELPINDTCCKDFHYLRIVNISLPSTDGENRIRLSYRNSPYFTKARLESSAVLKVSSNPRSRNV